MITLGQPHRLPVFAKTCFCLRLIISVILYRHFLMNLSTIKGFDARAIFFSVNTHLHFIAVHLLFAF